MTVPSPNEPWEPVEPMDPKDLPPGFYFPPGSKPGKRQAAQAGPIWMLVAIAVLLVLAGVVGVLWLF